MQTLRTALFGLLALALFPACSQTRDVAEGAGDVAVDVGEAVGDAAVATADFVTDAAGATYNAVADLFDGDDDLDAAALVRPTMAGSAQGAVRFYETDDGLRVTASLSGLDANQAHGFHLHQNPDCGPGDSDNDGQMEAAGAAGAHWDPHNTDNHGAPEDDPMSGKHLGDLGNVMAGADGTVEADFEVDAYRPGEHSVVGLAIVVHSGRDDLETDPGGGSGQRVGCGAVEGR